MIADPIIVHADVRRMLLTMKAYVEGARALLLWIAQLSDLSSRAEAREFVQLLTPMAKAFVTDICTEATNLGMQVMGGHGYIRESGMEQLARDVRVTQLYAGANGIQALDLVTRKLPARDGQVFAALLQAMEDSLATESDGAVRDAIAKLRASADFLRQQMPGDPHLAGSVGYAFLQLFGYVALGALWARTAQIAGQREQDFYDAKVATSHFYMQHLLPNVDRCVAAIRAGSSATMRLSAEAF